MGPLFCLTLIILNYFIFNKIISNVHNSKVDKKLCSVAACGILISFCHAAYDYGFHIPAYSFNIAIFYGLLLCKGKNYEDRDNYIFIKKLSRITFLSCNSDYWVVVCLP